MRLFFLNHKLWLNGWMNGHMAEPASAQTPSGRVYLVHDSNQWLLLGKRLAWEKGVGVLPFWGE